MVVDLELPEEPPRLVINYIVEVDGGSRSDIVRVSQSQSVLDNTDISLVSGALVTMVEDDECTMLREENEGCVVTFEERARLGDYYQTVPTRMLPGKTYTLRVEKEGFEPIVATTLAPEPTEILRIDYDTTVVSPPVVSQKSFSVNEVRITLNDPIEERNYYAVKMRANRRQEKCDSVGNCVLSNNSFRRFGVDMSSDDPAIVSSNYALQGSTTRIYGNCLPFNDELFNGEEYTVRINPDIFFYGDSLSPYLEVELITITEEQYNYEYQSWLQLSLREVPNSEPVLVSGNVQGGYGIFAGYSMDRAFARFR